VASITASGAGSVGLVDPTRADQAVLHQDVNGPNAGLALP